MGAPVRLQKAVPRTKENAAVERREANALRHWACAARRSSVTPRLSALRSPHVREGAFPLVGRGDGNARRFPRLARTGAAELWLFLTGCLTSDASTDEIARTRAKVSMQTTLSPKHTEGAKASL